MDVDFRYKGFDCAIIFGVLRWKPGEAHNATLSACWDDEWAKEMLHDYVDMTINEELKKRHKKADCKWMKKAFKEEFTKEEVLDFVMGGFERMKRHVQKQGQAIPNIDVIPGRKVES